MSKNQNSHGVPAAPNLKPNGPKAPDGELETSRTPKKLSERSSERHLWKSPYVDLGVIGEYSDPRRLYLDFDGAVPSLLRILETLDTWEVNVIRLTQRHSSRRGYHVIVETQHAHDPITITMMQACLGSDRYRECHNARRALFMRRYGSTEINRKRWNILFKEKL